MIQSIIVLVAIGALVEMWRRAHRRYRQEATLPMRWLPDGTVAGTAPRGFALGLIPVLAIFILAATLAMTIFLEPKPGQGAGAIPAVAFSAAVLIGVYAYLLRRIARSLGR